MWELEALLEGETDDPILIHPGMAEIYRTQVAGLIEALNDEAMRAEAIEVIRGLIEAIVLTPDTGCGLTIDLQGALAGILSLASGNEKTRLDQRGGPSRTKVGCGGRI